MRQGNLSEALLRARGNLSEAYQSSLAIRERLASADRGNAGWQRDLSVSHNKIGDVLVEQGNLSEALEAYQSSLAIRERLASSDRGNAGWQRDLSVSHERIGDVANANGDTERAITAFSQAIAIYESLLKRNPDDSQARLFSVVPRWRLGALLGSAGLPHLKAAYAILKPLADADRLDTQRTSWIPQIEAAIRASEGGGRADPDADAQDEAPNETSLSPRGWFARNFGWWGGK